MPKTEALTLISAIWLAVCLAAFGLHDLLTLVFFGLLAWCVFEQQKE